MRIFTLFILLSTLLFAQTEAPLITQINTTNLVEGENALFSLIFREHKPSQELPDTINIDGLAVSPEGFQRLNHNGERYYVYQYSVTPERSGRFTIPAMDFQQNGKTVRSIAVELNAVSLDLLHKERFKHNNSEIVCYSKLFAKKTTLYPGESTELEYKVYLPRSTNPRGWGLPKPENTFNCTAWRFNAPTDSQSVGKARINGQRYVVISYTTVLSALQAGDASFGPLATDLTISPPSVDAQFGFFRRNTVELPITFAATAFDVLPFPTAKPADFTGAVGDFSIEVGFDNEPEINLTDSITATLTVTGEGNLPDLVAPSLEDSATWKVIDVSRVQQGDERKELRGKAEFSYILQPKRGAKALPRFTFVHFNPNTKEFYHDTTDTSPLTVLEPVVAGSVILPENTIQKENMQDILAPLASVKLTSSSSSVFTNIPSWSWQLVPAALLLGILLTAARRKILLGRTLNTDTKLKETSLKALESSSDSEFLKLAGAYIEQWCPDNKEAQDILELRDNQCYQPSNKSSLDKKKRRSIIQSLKKFSVLLALLCIGFGTNAEATEEGFSLWEKGNIVGALDHYTAQSEQHPDSADLLYNIGSCYYRLNQAGKAALYFERALALDPSHVEAQKNLGFTQQLQGSILPSKGSNIEQWLSKFPANYYKQASIACTWLLVLSLSALTLLQLQKKNFYLSLTALLLSTILLVLCGFGWLQHPQRVAQSEGESAVIVEYTALLTEPIAVDGKELEKKTLINATPASPCRIIATRGAWSYIALANGTRGWVPAEKVSAL